MLNASRYAGFFCWTFKMLLCLLSKRILWIIFSCLPGNYALKNGGDFWWIFSGLRLPRNEARKILEKFGENSEQNSGKNSGRKFWKFGELSFCNFSDLTSCKKSDIFPVLNPTPIGPAATACLASISTRKNVLTTNNENWSHAVPKFFFSVATSMIWAFLEYRFRGVYNKLV